MNKHSVQEALGPQVRGGEIGMLNHSFNENGKNDEVTLGNGLAAPQNAKHNSPYDPAIPYLGMEFTQELKMYIHKETCT